LSSGLSTSSGSAFTTPASQLRRAVVTSTRFKPAAHPLARELAERLEALGAEVLLDLQGTAPLARDARDTDVVFSVGGDGTLLGTARRLVGSTAPVVGVNLGKLGFLAEFSADEVREYLDGRQPEDWRINPRIMLQVWLNGAGEPTYALNDVVVSQGLVSRLVNIAMDVDGAHAIHYRADGLVVSTPVGSTAYALSLGGPIVSQALRAFVITPMAPFSLTNRPIVVEGSVQVGFRVETEINELALVVDGQDRIDLAQGDRITIAAAPTDLMLISSGRHSFFDLLRLKLGWGAPPTSLQE
jgi:NAD+ kinase